MFVMFAHFFSVTPVLGDRTKWIPLFESYAANHSLMDTKSYALYNVVLAIGSRAYLSQSTKQSYELSQQEGWGYFQNALLEFVELFHGRSDLRGVQAMALMVS